MAEPHVQNRMQPADKMAGMQGTSPMSVEKLTQTSVD